jgi:uncharacterized protein YqgV (UPF0045/DUF77 family)
MKASVEISMYPLTKEYGTPILQFIHRLKEYPELEIRSNTMSTQVFGEYDDLMSILTKEMKASFSEELDTVMVFKIANLDLR